MATVILAEKPDQGKKFAAALNQGKIPKNLDGKFEFASDMFGQTIVTWGVGHLVGLSMPEKYGVKTFRLDALPFLPAKEEMLYEVQEGKGKQFKVVKECVERADAIIIATDPDREGENIAYNIFKLCKTAIFKKPMKRLWINSLTTDEILRGFRQLRDAKETVSFFKEANARQIADYLVGMNYSPLYTVKLKEQGLDSVFSLGRVQTPTNTLIVENDLAIANFKAEPYKMLECHTKDSPPTVFSHKTEYFDEIKFQQDMEKHRLKEAKTGIIKDVSVENKEQPSPKLFSLGAIQKYANSRWKYPTKKTDSILQKLYQDGVLSYPRTDSELITTNEFAYLKKNLGKYQQLLGADFEAANLMLRKRYVDDKKVLEHYALIPTTQLPNLGKLSAEERNLYLAILERTLLMFAGNYKYEHTKVVLDVNALEFNATGTVPLEWGWKQIDKFEEKTAPKLLPKFQVGEIIPITVKVLDKLTQAPKRLTEGTLVGKGGLMDKLNLGTPATRSGIIEKLVQRGYIKIEKTQVIPTPSGYLLWDLTKNRDQLIGNPEMTAKWEAVLVKISTNDYTREAFLEQIHRFIRTSVEELKAQPFSSQYVSGSTSQKSFSTGGYQIVDKSKVYAITTAEGQSFTIFKTFSGKTLTLKVVEELLKYGKTRRKVKGLKSKAGNRYEAFLGFNPTDKKVFLIIEDTPQEPVDIAGFQVTDKGRFYDITGESPFTISKTIAGKDLSTAHLKDLLTTGKSSKIEGFKSKAGKKFSASLKLNPETKKIEFQFD
ncbi:MAG: DNA topoisomerase [Turicibacter sp.]|nr:DNA topoisomerase [Turicibacter sp.]